MKSRTTILSLLLLCMFTIQAVAQQQNPTTLQGWAERLQKFGKSLPQEQIFIHMDNTCYFLGDTIYFKAYVRRSDGMPTNLSTVLYAELLNQDGYLVQRKLLELKNGQVHGDFALQDTLYGGYYELRAYTRWQLNWGEYQHDHVKFSEKWFFNKHMAREYYRDYEKLYSRVFPVYDKPQNPGEFEHFMTFRPLRRQYKAEGTPPEGSIQLYPEGGHLIAGVPNRVAFEANDEEGMHIEGNVVVTDASGAKVAEAGTELRGRGTLEFTPKAGVKYSALLTWKFGTAKQKLPDAEPDGVALQIAEADEKIVVKAHAAGKAASEPLGLTVMCQGVMQDFREMGAGTELTAEINKSELSNGVCQFTIFNAEGRIYADRLSFIRNGDLKPQNLVFTGIKAQEIEPFGAVSFGIEGGKGGSTVSLAVRDAEHCEYIHDSGNILTEMLLSSQIRGFVENPGFFFEVNDKVHNRALDLLLMIQGWRRYNWHDMATPGAFVLNHMPEKTPLIMGEVNNYTAQDAEDEFAISSDEDEESSSKSNDKDDESEEKGSETTGKFSKDNTTVTSRFNAKESPLKREVLVHARFKKQGTEGVVGEMMTENAGFSIQSPRFYEGCVLQLAASDSTKWAPSEKQGGYGWLASGVTKDGFINYPEFYVRLRNIYPRFVKPYNWYQCNLAEAPKGSAIAPDWLNDGSRALAQVTIGARRTRYTKFDASKPAFVIDAYEAFNEACDAGLCSGYYMGRNRFIHDLARTYIGDMNMGQEYDVQIRLNSKLTSYLTDREKSKQHIGGLIPDMPEESSNISSRNVEMFNRLANINKVYIYTDYSPRREGDDHYKGNNQPMVTVDLRTYEDESKRETYRDRVYLLPGFSAPEDFYQPNYSTKPLPDTKDYRRTLYWNPELQLDAEGKASVTFYNNCKRTQIAVSAEGMASDGTLYTGKNMPEDR